jgi:hypothetical protein
MKKRMKFVESYQGSEIYQSVENLNFLVRFCNGKKCFFSEEEFTNLEKAREEIILYIASGEADKEIVLLRDKLNKLLNN